jgi:hypothetical protein
VKRLPAVSLVVACLLAAGPPAAGAAGWRSLSSDAFLVLYPDGRESEALEALAVLEQERAYVQGIVGGRTRRVTVVIQDLGIESNGLTDPTFHRILLFPTASGAGDLSFYQSWWRLLGVHEYTHWQHLSARGGLPGFVVGLAGTWAAPGNCTPSWLKEGICVYAESGLSPFEGRLNEGTYEAILAALAREGELPSLVEATFQPLEFPGVGASVRLLGGSFFAYLARTYGPESLRRFFDRFASSGWSYLSPLLPWAGVDHSARRVFGKGMPELWLDWQADVIERHAPAASVCSAEPVTRFPEPPVAKPADWGITATVAWQGVLYYQRQRPEKPAAFGVEWHYELVRYDPASARREVLYSTTAPFYGPLRVCDGILYFAVQELRPGYANREYGSYGVEAVLYGLNLRQPRRPQRVAAGAFRTFEVLPGGAVLLSRDEAGAFGSQIQLLAAGTRRPRRLLESEWRVEELLYDGQSWLYLSARRRGENTGLYRVSLPVGQLSALEAGELPALRPEAILHTAYAEKEIALGGQLLLFSANWAGRHCVYAWQPRDRSVARLDTGEGFCAAPSLAGGQVYVAGLEASGYLLRGSPLALVPLSPPEPPSSQGKPVPVLPESEPRRGQGGYWYNLGSLLPRALIPVLGFDSAAGRIQAGALLSGLSALGDIFYTMGAYYDSADHRPELNMYLGAQLAPPLQVSVSYTTAGADRLSGSVEVPLYRSLQPGLSLLVTGLSASIFEDDYSRRAVEPLLRVGLQAPGSALQLSVSLPLESRALGSAEEDRALLAGLDWRQLLFGARLRLNGSGVYDLQGQQWLLPTPRGYAGGLSASCGAVLSAELSLALLRVRRGLWNPAIFFEDLFLVPFFDLALNETGELQWSAGGSLHLEVKGLAQNEGVPLDLSLGFVVTREGEPGLLLALELPLFGQDYGPVGGGFRPPWTAAARGSLPRPWSR